MKRTFGLLAALTLLAAGPLRAADSEAVSKAKAAATAWLALTDAGKFGESWDQASSLFRGSISRIDWSKQIAAVRPPLGAVKSRTLRSASYTRNLPGAPDGEYVVIQFDTAFEKKSSAVETVTPQREKDGSWRVSGYYIR